MTVNELIGALGRACGRFEEGYGSDFDSRDSVDVLALADILHAEIQRIIEREVASRVEARMMNEREALAREREELADERKEFAMEQVAERLRKALDEWGTE